MDYRQRVTIMKILLQTLIDNVLLTEREARKNVKINFNGVDSSEWENIISELYGIDYDITIEREIREILSEDLDGNEDECKQCSE